MDGYSAKFRMGGWTWMEVKRCSDSWMDKKIGWMDMDRLWAVVDGYQDMDTNVSNFSENFDQK